MNDNEHRMSLRSWKEENGIETESELVEMLEEAFSEGVVPALCTEGCEVEPDGMCPHDCPSIMLAAGLV